MEDTRIPIIGIHMNGSTIDFAVVQQSTILMRGEPMEMLHYLSPDAALVEIGYRLLELKKICPAVRAVGMGLTGFTDHENGTVHSLNGVPGWHDIPIRRILTEISGLPAAIDNDANCIAYAEWKMGVAQGKSDLICLSLGQGIGSGIIANNHFIRGRYGTAGEVGQGSIDYRGRIGHYGNRGAIENYVGTATITRDACIAYAAAGKSYTEAQCCPRKLASYAQSGCAVAEAIWDDVGRKLASSLATCCYLLNPEAIILGGELACAGESLLTPLKHYLRNQLFFTYYDALEILPAHFGDEAGIIGAARLALDSCNEQEED